MIGQEEVEKRKEDITEALSQHKIGITKIMATVGPRLTLYEVVPEPGIKVSSIRKLEEDIALSLAAEGVRIIAPVPGKGTVGIEVPNEQPDTVDVDDMESSTQDKELPLLLGKTVEGEEVCDDLTDFPHLLMAGATGQGKSISVNSIIYSIVNNSSPDHVKFLLIDPKRVELSPYKDMHPYLLSPKGVVTDMDEAISMLDFVCKEMDDRYELLEKARVRNIKDYHRKKSEGELLTMTGYRDLPYITVIIDEFADLIMNAGKEAEDKIVRLAQLARAVGIHLIITTQRPSSNVVTGLIKSNIPVRMSFKLPTNTDSRTVLDEKGAENLLGKGDVLLKTATSTHRLQACYIDMDKIDKMIDHKKGLEHTPYNIDPDVQQQYEGPEETTEVHDRTENDNVLINEGLAKYLESVSDFKELSFRFGDNDTYFVIDVDRLWFVYYDPDNYEHDKNIISQYLST